MCPGFILGDGMAVHWSCCPGRGHGKFDKNCFSVV